MNIKNLQNILKEVISDLKKAKGEEKQRRKVAASKEMRSRGLPKYKKNPDGKSFGPDNPHAGHYFGINHQAEFGGHKKGTSVVGAHIRDKADPVIPLREQRADNIKDLKGASKPNLPKSEDSMKKTDPKTKLQGVLLDKAHDHNETFKKIIEATKNKLDKAKIYDIKSKQMIADLGQPEHTTPPKGELKAVGEGFKPEKAKFVSKKPAKQKMAKTDLNKDAAPAPAPMPKPAMPKMKTPSNKKPKMQAPSLKMPSKLAHSELEKADHGKHSYPKSGEKGVHQPPSRMSEMMNIQNNPGKSTAGFHARMGAKDKGVDSQWKANSRRMHEEKLKELKDMPKADLPKSELKKDGGTAANPTSRVDTGFGRVIVKSDNMWKSFMEKCMKCMSMKKDDKPHAKGTPEHAAHEVVESGKSLTEAIAQVKDKEKMMDHLRTLDNPKNLRSPENKKSEK